MKILKRNMIQITEVHPWMFLHFFQLYLREIKFLTYSLDNLGLLKFGISPEVHQTLSISEGVAGIRCITRKILLRIGRIEALFLQYKKGHCPNYQVLSVNF